MSRAPISVAIAEASPALKLIKAFWYINTGRVMVALTGPPFVVIQIRAKEFRLYTRPKKNTKPIIEPIMGKIK